MIFRVQQLSWLLGCLGVTAATSAEPGGAPPFNAGCHAFEWATQRVGEDADLQPRLMYRVCANTTIPALPLGDGTFAQVEASCESRSDAKAEHRCTFRVSEAELRGALETKQSIAPGGTVTLGDLVKTDGSKIKLAVTAAQEQGRPFQVAPVVARAKEKAHVFWIQVVDQKTKAAAPPPGITYSFEAKARINRYQLPDGTQSKIALACRDRASPSEPHQCQLDIQTPGLADLHVAFSARPGQSSLFSQLGKNRSPVEWKLTALAPHDHD